MVASVYYLMATFAICECIIWTPGEEELPIVEFFFHPHPFLLFFIHILSHSYPLWYFLHLNSFFPLAL